MVDKLGANLNLDNIFEEMYSLISEASRIPLTDKIIIEESDLAGIMDDLKEAIPKEVKNATEVLGEQKNIVARAREEADAIVAQAKAEAERVVGLAREEADRIISEQEIVKQAQAVADDLKASAEREYDEKRREADEYAVQTKTDALQYSDDVLGYLSDTLQSALKSVEGNRTNISDESKIISQPALPASSEENAEEQEPES